MIKKYKQFIKGRVNEDFTLGAPEVAPVTPQTLPPPEEMPAPPQIIPGEDQSPYPAPAKAELPEEEGGEYQGQRLMAELAESLGVDIEEDGSINYNGQKINFYSETEMFHVGKSKFKTVDEVINFLESGPNQPMAAQKPMNNKPMADIDEDEYHKGDMPFESKSYKFSRKHRRK
jgi:hypothetical protein